MSGINEFGGDLPPEREAGEFARANVVIESTPEEFRLVRDQWGSYTRARDAGHLDYVREARRLDDYYFGEQWNKEVRATLDAQGRPAHTFNLVLSTVNAVVGEYIKSRQDISFAPFGKGANQETAKSLRFLFKQIAINNDSEIREKNVFLDGLIQDRGYFYYYMDFSDNLEGEVRELIVDPTDIILDPGAKEYDPETWNEVFISRWMTPDEIGALYGIEFRDRVELSGTNGSFGHDSLEWEAPNFSGNHYNSEIFFQSPQDDIKRVKRIRVIERQYKRLTRTAFFVDRETGDMRRVPSGWDDEKRDEFAERMDLHMIWKPERRIRITITADRILLHDDWSLFDKISVVPFFPYFRRGRPFGLVRNLLSPQDMLNKVTSQELHVVNTTANSGWIFESGSLVNMDTEDLLQQGSKTGLVLEFNKGSEKPEKIQPNQIPTGLAEISNKAGIFFKEISGVNEAQLGQGRSDSSKALDNRKQGGLAQQEIIFDNLDYTRKLRAELILHIVQRYYTETRLIQVFEKNEDGDTIQTELAVNEGAENEFGEVDEILNDLTLGEYSVVISSVPRRDTYEEALFDQLISMREAGVQIPDHVLIEASQLPDKAEVSETVKQIQGLAAPTEEELQKQAQIDELQLRLLTAEVMETEAQAQERSAHAQELMAKAQAAVQQPQMDQLKLGVEARLATDAGDRELQSNREDLMVRLQIAREKGNVIKDVEATSSMTKRTQSMLQRETDLDKALIALKGKRSPAKKE